MDHAAYGTVRCLWMQNTLEARETCSKSTSVGIEGQVSPVAPILDLSETLSLSVGQHSALVVVGLDFEATAVRLLSEREQLRIAAERARAERTSIPLMTEEQLRAIEGKTLELKVAWLEAMTRARAILLVEQQNKLGARPSEPPSFASEAVSQTSSGEVEARIGAALDKRIKDTKVLEIETSHAIAERLLGWAKSFALVVGIPLALLGIILGGLGIKSYDDFMKMVDKGQNEVAQKIADASKKAVDLSERADKLQSRLASVEASLRDASVLRQDLNDLSKKVETIEKTLIRNPAVEGKDLIVAAEAWGGAFWEIRSILGRERADRLLFQTASQKLEADPPETLWRRFAQSLTKNASATLGISEGEKVAEVFKGRGLTLPP